MLAVFYQAGAPAVAEASTRFLSALIEGQDALADLKPCVLEAWNAEGQNALVAGLWSYYIVRRSVGGKTPGEGGSETGSPCTNCWKGSAGECPPPSSSELGGRGHPLLKEIGRGLGPCDQCLYKFASSGSEEVRKTSQKTGG